jgi:hypothetical protein
MFRTGDPGTPERFIGILTSTSVYDAGVAPGSAVEYFEHQIDARWLGLNQAGYAPWRT